MVVNIKMMVGTTPLGNICDGWGSYARGLGDWEDIWQMGPLCQGSVGLKFREWGRYASRLNHWGILLANGAAMPEVCA